MIKYLYNDTVSIHYSRSVNEIFRCKAENSYARKIIAIQYHVKIKSNPIKAIVDIGAAISIMTKLLMKKLELRINSPSKIIIVIANGKKKRALRQIHNILLVI